MSLPQIRESVGQNSQTDEMRGDEWRLMELALKLNRSKPILSKSGLTSEINGLFWNNNNNIPTSHSSSPKQKRVTKGKTPSGEANLIRLPRRRRPLSFGQNQEP